MSERQAEYLLALKREPGWGWSWVRASVEIDLAMGHTAGQSALSWMTAQGVSPSAAWPAVEAACREAGVRNAAPEPPAQAPSVAPDWDTAATVDAARIVGVGSDRAPGPTACIAPGTASRAEGGAASAERSGERSPRAEPVTRADESAEPGLAAIREVIERLRQQYPDLPVTGTSRAGTPPLRPLEQRPLRSTPDLRRHRQRAQEAAERARREAQRRRGPYAS